MRFPDSALTLFDFKAPITLPLRAFWHLRLAYTHDVLPPADFVQRSRLPEGSTKSDWIVFIVAYTEYIRLLDGGVLFEESAPLFSV